MNEEMVPVPGQYNDYLQDSEIDFEEEVGETPGGETDVETEVEETNSKDQAIWTGEKNLKDAQSQILGECGFMDGTGKLQGCQGFYATSKKWIYGVDASTSSPAILYFGTRKTELYKYGAITGCICNFTNGKCPKLDFCIQFDYALSYFDAGNSINALAAFAKSSQKYTSGWRNTSSSPAFTPVPDNSILDDITKFKTLKADIKLECGERMAFGLATASSQSKIITVDNISIKLGRC